MHTNQYLNAQRKSNRLAALPDSEELQGGPLPSKGLYPYLGGIHCAKYSRSGFAREVFDTCQGIHCVVHNEYVAYSLYARYSLCTTQ